RTHAGTDQSTFAGAVTSARADRRPATGTNRRAGRGTASCEGQRQQRGADDGGSQSVRPSVSHGMLSYQPSLVHVAPEGQVIFRSRRMCGEEPGRATTSMTAASDMPTEVTANTPVRAADRRAAPGILAGRIDPTARNYSARGMS